MELNNLSNVRNENDTIGKPNLIPGSPPPEVVLSDDDQSTAMDVVVLPDQLNYDQSTAITSDSHVQNHKMDGPIVIPGPLPSVSAPPPTLRGILQDLNEAEIESKISDLEIFSKKKDLLNSRSFLVCSFSI